MSLGAVIVNVVEWYNIRPISSSDAWIDLALEGH